MRQRHVFCIWMSKILKTLWFLCDHSHQIICILQICHLCYCAVGVKAHKENNKVLMFCASKYKLHVAKTKHNVKTPDTIFCYAYWAYQIVFFCLVINIILGVMSCHDHLRWICSYTLIFREYPQLTHRLALQFLVMPIVFMHVILQTWSWLKSKNLTILVMGNNGIVQCKVTFVQASCFINDISDNNSINFWKTIVFLQTCATREYDVITMLVLIDVFPRAPFENRFVYLLFSSHLQTGRGVIWRHFHTPVWEHT